MMADTGFSHRLSTSPEAFQATMSSLLRPCRFGRKLGRDYRTEVIHARMPSLGLTFVRMGETARIGVDAHEDMTLLQIPLAGAFVSREPRGRDLVCRAGASAQLVNANAPIDLEFEPDTSMLILNLDRRQIDILGGKSRVDGFTHASRLVALDSGVGRAFYKLAVFATRELEIRKQAFFEGGLAEHLEDTLIASLEAALDIAAPVDIRTAGPAGGRIAIAPSIIRRAEAFMADSLTLPVKLTDIVAASGASARTLHRMFREVRGDTPLGVLKTMRLDAVHARLTSGKAGNGDVTRIATELGFNHMGLFAADYRSRFGLLPSDTIRLSRTH